MSGCDFEALIREVEPALPDGTTARLAEAARRAYTLGSRDGLLLAAGMIRDRAERAQLRDLAVGRTGTSPGRDRRTTPEPPF